jgi:hypothetical protein
VLALAILNGAIASLQLDPSDNSFSVSGSFYPVVIGGAQSVFGIVVGPILLAVVGGWLGGQADATGIRQAVAWSYVPCAAATVFWIPILLVLGANAFRQDFMPAGAVEWLAMLLLIVALPVPIVWTLVLSVITLAEVQRFSIVRTIASMILPLVPFLLFGLLRS